MRYRSVHHIGLVTGQFEQMQRFYVKVLGMPIVGAFPERQIVFLAAGATRIELLGESTSCTLRSHTGWNHLALEVDNINSAFTALAALGVEVSSPPEDFPPEAPEFRIAFLRDPDGNLVELIQRIGGQ